MEEFTFFERITRVLSMFFSSSFFIALFIIGVITVILFLLNNKIDKEKRPFLYIGMGLVYVVVAILVFIKYGSGIVLIGDAFIEKLFTAIYFPNIISYMCMLIISMLIMVYSIFNKKYSSFFRLCNLLSCLIIGLLTILIIDSIVTADIDVYEKVSIYSSTNTMVLIQSSMGVFTIWLSVLMVNGIVNLITRRVVKEEDTYVDVDVTEVVPYTEQEYIDGYINYTKKKKYQEYLNEILK
jgi:glucan phosphoethanolaminetransferase (alkaline phosphatase superfamily)